MTPPRLRTKPYARIRSSIGTFQFHHADALEFLRGLPIASVDLIVTSPPYNLGVSYRSYRDALPEKDYLEWTDQWIAAATRTLTPRGSLFLNVGATPTRPWTALDVAQTARRHLKLQNIIHWVKSIAIDRAAGRGDCAAPDDKVEFGHRPDVPTRLAAELETFLICPEQLLLGIVILTAERVV